MEQVFFFNKGKWVAHIFQHKQIEEKINKNRANVGQAR